MILFIINFFFLIKGGGAWGPKEISKGIQLPEFGGGGGINAYLN